jgi:putative ABC transport system permease protein
MNLIILDISDLLLAALLIFLNGGFSIWLRLSLERQLFIAALRMVVQLTLMGFILKTLFAISSLPFTLAALTFMGLFAGYEVRSRQDRRFTGVWSYGVGLISMFFSVTLIMVYTLSTQIQPEPWYAPRYTIPLFGMVLGNTMTGVSLGLNTLTSQLVRERVSVEAQLALGAPFLQAVRPVLRGAAKTGFIPIVNSMAAVGLVSLPGMMTGQILSGVDPMEAIKYQMLIMFLITGGTGLGVIFAVHIGAWRLTDRRHRLRLERLVQSKD